MERKWLKDIRCKLGFTQQNVADRCNITRVYYTQIENGIRNPSVIVAKRISKAMNFNWTIFFKDTCNETKHKGGYMLPRTG